jgi:bifunctional non-homologous end joining protein LigD
LALRVGRETRVLSRNQKDLGKKFTKIRDSTAALDVQDVILDGEIVALDDKGRPSFQLLQGFDMGLVLPPIVFYAFDLLRLNGQDLRSLPIEECKAKLASLLKRPPADIRYSASFYKNIDELLSRVRELSLEGLIGKRAGSKYDSKRSGAWIKIKLYQQGSFVIGGYTQPAGERKHMGALLVGVNENGKLKFAGRVGTGFSEKVLKILSLELNKIAVKSCPFFNLPATGRGLDSGLTVAEMRRCIWVKPSMVCEVKFTEWTRDDRLRQPVFLGIREDKSAERGHPGEGKLGNLSRSLIASRRDERPLAESSTATSPKGKSPFTGARCAVGGAWVFLFSRLAVGEGDPRVAASLAFFGFCLSENQRSRV